MYKAFVAESRWYMSVHLLPAYCNEFVACVFGLPTGFQSFIRLHNGQ